MSVTCPAGERSVANSLQVICTAPTGPLRYLEMQPKRAELYQGASLQLQAAGTDQYFNPVSLPPDARWEVPALLGSVSQAGVFVAAAGQAQLRWLALGEEVGDRVPVRAGLAADEAVIDSPGALHDGQRIEVAP